VIPSKPLAEYLAHKDEIDAAIAQVLAGGSYILGPEVAGFEKDFAAYIGARYALGVGSGTDALELALRACGVGPGDGVITVSHTAVATIAAVEKTGAVPMLVDIDPQNFTIDPNRLEDAIKAHRQDKASMARGCLKAIIPVHLYGGPANICAVADVARRHELYVIEDCAQSHGMVIQGRKAGAWGDLSAFSFYPTKNLGALGDGGAIVVNDSELVRKIQLLREYGWRERYISEFPGMNSRLDEIQAAILRVKLKYLDKENARRRQLASIYDSVLAVTSLVLPQTSCQDDHVYHQYVVRSKDRDALRAFLKTNFVSTMVHYPMPVHLQPAYRGRVVVGPGGLQNTEQACREILSLPIHPQMSDQDARQVGELIVHWHKRGWCKA
jgi:dTDP-4-amino-4,6-dideoxygalactose transaminase